MNTDTEGGPTAAENAKIRGMIRAVFALTALIATPALADPIPPPVAAMIEAAAGNPDQLRVVANIARRTNPASIAEIGARVAEIYAASAKAR